jgi:hypothetical protein
MQSVIRPDCVDGHLYLLREGKTALFPVLWRSISAAQCAYPEQKVSIVRKPVSESITAQ